MQAMIATQLNEYVAKGKLNKHGIIQVEKVWTGRYH